MLRRKPAFQQLNFDVTTSYPVVLICRHPEEDYCPVPGNACFNLGSTAWVGACRKRQNRRLVVVQEVKNAELLDLKCLAQIAAPNVARIHALYHQDNRFFAAYEYIDLDITEIGPLSDKEIANIFLQVRALLVFDIIAKEVAPFAELSQVLRGIQRLLILSIGFRIDSVRANSNGDVKIVLDWSYEPLQERHMRAAGVPYIALYLQQIMEHLGGFRRMWTQSASSFLALLQVGHLPAITVSALRTTFVSYFWLIVQQHPFLSQTEPLRLAASFALRRKLAGL